MIKNFLAIGMVAFSLASCGGGDFDMEAQALCDCMVAAEVEAEELGFSLGVETDYSVCIKEISIDIKDDQFAKAIESKCPDLAETHAEYLKGL